jgi:hypothetical protein
MYGIAAILLGIAACLYGTAAVLKVLGIHKVEPLPELTLEEKEALKAQAEASRKYAAAVENLTMFGYGQGGERL